MVLNVSTAAYCGEERYHFKGWSLFPISTTATNCLLLEHPSTHFKHLYQLNSIEMGKKRSITDLEDESNNDQVETATTAQEEGVFSPSPTTKKKDMHLRSGKTKRRRSKETSGLTPPPTSKRAKKKRKLNGDDQDDETRIKKPSAVTFAESKTTQELQVEETSSPLEAGPRRISYSGTYGARTNDNDDESGSSEEEESNEIDAIPPQQIPPPPAQTTQTKTTSEEAVVVPTTKPTVDTETKDQVADDIADRDEPKDSSKAIPTWQRLAIFVVLGYLSLLLSMPQVVKLTQTVVPLDDSILPPNRRANSSSTDTTLNMEELSENLKQLQQATSGYSSSKDSFQEYYQEILGRVGDIAAQLGPKQQEMEDRIQDLTRLETLLKELSTDENENEEWDEARRLAQQLLGGSVIATSSIQLWDVQENTDVECYHEIGEGYDDDDDFNDDDDDLNDDASEVLLEASLLEEKISNLLLRSTITAEKFVGGAVAENRIRAWVRSRIEKMMDDDEEALQVIQEMEEFALSLADAAPSTTTTYNSNLELSQIIQGQLDVHRADTTGVYDYASLKNGAEIVYGGKRGTSKSLVDELPVLNRILQNSNLRFYGFGPEAALTATYPPSALGQCWSFRQTSLKEQLAERQLFEHDTAVKNDFKRGNFGTLTIRLSEPIAVQSIVIEHPLRASDSAIRKFRLVGFEDEMATSKAWNLGSFEYKANHHKQEFATATTVFGKEIPHLASISLAVDSNYGHDYSCLYRIRVHGDPN